MRHCAMTNERTAVSKLFILAMIAVLSCLVFVAAASATGVTIGSSDPTRFTATTNGLQTLTTTVLGIYHRR